MFRFIFLSCLLVLGSAAGHAEPLSFGGFKLGMTFDEFKTKSHPNAENYKGEKIYALCTGDDRAPAALMVAGNNVKLGFIYCKHYTKKTTSAGESYQDVMLSFATISVSPKFAFVPSPKGGVKQLGYIFIDAEMRNWDKLYAAYQAEYGKPSEVSKEKMNTGTGAVIDKLIAVWKNPDSFIFLEQRTNDQIDLMTIDYTHKALSDFTTQRRKALPAK